MSKYILPKGKYFIGDICYILKKSYYNQWVDKLKGKNGLFNINGSMFAVHSTSYGDGYYPSNINMSFPVDSGTIGIVNEKLFSATKAKKLITKNMTLGQIYNFTGDVTFKYKYGVFKIESSKDKIKIKIDTNE